MLDKERHMRLTIRGMKKFKEATGKELTSISGALDADSIGAVCFALLVWEDKSLTMEAAVEMVEVVDIRLVQKAISECMASNSPLAESPATS